MVRSYHLQYALTFYCTLLPFTVRAQSRTVRSDHEFLGRFLTALGRLQYDVHESVEEGRSRTHTVPAR